MRPKKLEMEHQGKVTAKRQALVAWIFVVPALLFHFIFIFGPMLSSLFFSMTEWNGIGKPLFTGLDNYRFLLRDPGFKNAFLNNLKWTAAFAFAAVFMGLVVAFLLSGIKRGQMLFRTAYFVPYVVAAAMASKIWAAMMNNYFGINVLFRALGWTKLGNILWLGNEHISLFAVAFVNFWNYWPFVMVLFLSALQQIEPELYQSAKVDGANRLQEFLYVTIPCIRNTILFVSITIIMWSFLTYDYVWIMTAGGPGQSTDILATYVYRTGFKHYDVGYANTLCVIQAVISMGIYWVLQVFNRKGNDV